MDDSDPVDRIPDAGESDGSDPEAVRSELRRLRSEFDELRAALSDTDDRVEDLGSELDDRTVHREEIESDLKGYVRRRLRRGHARGWGPYLVLLYGTIMTIGAFAYLSGGWSILAMVVIWLSTLGLYVLMVLTGLAVSVLSAPRRAAAVARSAREKIRDVRS